MNGCVLTLKTPLSLDLNAKTLGPQLLTASADEISRFTVEVLGSREMISVGELFHVKPTSDGHAVIEGDLRSLHHVGCGWSQGNLTIVGNVGNQLATAMSGGTVTLEGHAGDAAGQQMRGGELRIKGDVGNDLGGPAGGRRSGLSGGKILIGGSAGNYAGYRMRRGMILIQGNCGDFLGCDMVAGTILVNGAAGERVATGMRRGTIVVPTGTRLDPNRFSQGRMETLSFAQILATEIQHEAARIAQMIRLPLCRSLGDRTAGGMGEIWQFSQ